MKKNNEFILYVINLFFVKKYLNIKKHDIHFIKYLNMNALSLS